MGNELSREILARVSQGTIDSFLASHSLAVLTQAGELYESVRAFQDAMRKTPLTFGPYRARTKALNLPQCRRSPSVRVIEIRRAREGSGYDCTPRNVSVTYSDT